MPNSTLNNEKELLDRAAHDDEAAFSQLFYAYHNKLGTYVFRLTQSRETAEEIVQDVFLKIWIDRRKLTTIRHFGAYVYVLTRNQTLNCLRRLAKERVRNRKTLENIKAYYTADVAPDTAPNYFSLIDKAVDELPPQQQKVYLLSRRERMKYEEIASYMGISRETVKKYLQLATHFITRYLRSHGDLLLIILLVTLFS